eukprot:TRINITY_DN2758_c0_g1_i5.p1 TRINITY_DN2758_c0_g1~~TRINITY_DN2758_c0_g1_i5.p1  ORF type:complete len:1103 (+),score=240.39 TRINITY_DN2758_c0_g1_i5:81-3389(+)
MFVFFFFFQAEDGIRDAQESRGLGDVYKRQVSTQSTGNTTRQGNVHRQGTSLPSRHSHTACASDSSAPAPAHGRAGVARCYDATADDAHAAAAGDAATNRGATECHDGWRSCRTRLAAAGDHQQQQQQQEPPSSSPTTPTTTTTTAKRRSIGDMSRHVLESVSSMQMEMLTRHEIAFTEAAATAMLPKLPGPGTPTQSAAFMMMMMNNKKHQLGGELPPPLIHTPSQRIPQGGSIPAFEVDEPARSRGADESSSSTPQAMGTNISTPLNTPQDPSATGSPPQRCQSSASLKSSADINRELTLPAIGKGASVGSGVVVPFSLEGVVSSSSAGHHRGTPSSTSGAIDGALPAIDGHQRRPTGGGSNPGSPQGRNNSRGGNLSSMSRRRPTGSHSSLGDFGLGSSVGSEHHPASGTPFTMGGMLTLEGSSMQVSRNPSRRQSFVVTGGTINVPTATSEGGIVTSSSTHGSGSHWRRRASTKLDLANPDSTTTPTSSSTINPSMGDGPAITLDNPEQPLGPKRLSVVTLNMLPSATNTTSSGSSTPRSGTSPNPSKQTSSNTKNGTTTSSTASAPGGKRSSKLAGVSVTSKTVVGAAGGMTKSAPSSKGGVKDLSSASTTTKASSPNNTTSPKQPPPKKSPSSTTYTTTTTTAKSSGGGDEVVPIVVAGAPPPHPPATKQPKKPPTPNAKKSRPPGITINTNSGSSYPVVKSILAGSSQKRGSKVKAASDDPSNNTSSTTTPNTNNANNKNNIINVRFAEHDEVVWIPPREPKVLASNGGSLGGSASDDESPPDSNASSTTSQHEWQASAPHSPSTIAVQNFDTTGASASDGSRSHHQQHVQIDIKKALAMVLPFDDEDELEGMTIPTVTTEDTSPIMPPPSLGATTTAEGSVVGVDGVVLGVDGQPLLPGLPETALTNTTVITIDPSSTSASSTQPQQQQQLSSITNKPLPPHIQRILDKQQEKARQRSSHDRVPHRYTTMGALVTGNTEGGGGAPSSSSSAPSPSNAGGGGGSGGGGGGGYTSGYSGGGGTGYITPRQAGSLTAPPHMGPSTPSGGSSTTTNTGGGGGTPATSQITRGNSNSVASPPHLAPPSSGYISHHRRSK